MSGDPVPQTQPRLVYPPPVLLRFTLDDVQRGAEEWGLNCGPAAIAAIAGTTLDELRPHLGDFESKRYTNPTLMWSILNNLKLRWRNILTQCSSENQGMLAWPSFGLARIQWEGPWTAPGVPMRVRYRHTHWVAVVTDSGWYNNMEPGSSEPNIFDVNCMCVGGWVPLSEWANSVVPWLLGECEPKANGKWHLTHVVEIEKPEVRP
jgi:hypothetical protein